MTPASHALLGHTALTWGVIQDPSRLEDAVRDCSELGFQGIETGGPAYDWWEENRPGELAKLLKDHGIVMACLFEMCQWIDRSQAETILENARRWSDAAQSLGGATLMLVPGGRRDEPPYSLDEYKFMAETMNKAGEIASRSGLMAAMHPHWGTTAETRFEIEFLLTELDPALVGFAPDGGQIAKGGADPISVMRDWKDRIRHIHLKDLSPDWEEKRRRGEPLRGPEGYCELGEGVIDYSPLTDILADVGYDRWIMAELDVASRPARAAAELNRAYLRNVFGK